ncbi:cytochrome P450 [Halorussus litoreus]|uniref:cytochrome P450 n=1 Tax=Halorussus litoreus TaxID=1710536 RepID=UPI000E21F615|nr:cytochrome P450 [Halorussus litoreus]
MTRRSHPEREDGRKESADARSADAKSADVAPATARSPKPPGPSGFPVVDSTVAASRDPLGFTDELASYGDLVSYGAFGEEFVAVFDPRIVETVLVSENDAFVKGDFEQAFGDLLAPQGVAFTEGERWRRQRTALQSAFTPDRIESYAAEMVAATAARADDWADGEAVELGDAFAGLTLHILTRALFDLDLDAQRGAVVRDATEAIGAIMDRFGLLSFLPEWAPSRTERRYEAAMAGLDDLVDDLMAERRDEAAEVDPDRDDLLSLLVAAAEAEGTGIGNEETGMNAEVVRDQLVTFLFAGHETTSTALTYACWLLAGHPDVRRRLDAEIDRVLGGRDPSFADVSQLDYTEQVTKEALRLYPPVYALYRQPKDEVLVDDYRIPPDTTLQIATYEIQRDECWWVAPDEFRPERWQEENASDRPEYAYFPFGGGPRHCLGMRFAMTELQLVLATLARRVEFERVTDDLDLSMGLTLDPGAVEVRVRKKMR